LAELTALQAEILPRAARLVRPGGLLVYATCSLLPEENEVQIERFLAAAPEFSLDPPAAFPAPLEGPYLKLTPARHGTDGFFVAWLRRAPKAAPEAPTE
jgi:16S rRNA (cytosine967-C5)-methyltransferase